MRKTAVSPPPSVTPALDTAGVWMSLVMNSPGPGPLPALLVYPASRVSASLCNKVLL